MLFNSTSDWKQFLSVDDEKRLNELIEKASKYRGAYKNSPDVKTAQLWCTVLELKKENIILQKKIDKLLYVLDGMFDRIREQEHGDRKLIESLEKF